MNPIEHNPNPAFSVDTEGDLLISIASVATVIRQEHEWRGENITYDVGKEYYPEPEQRLLDRQ
jgi:hypothetical protein